MCLSQYQRLFPSPTRQPIIYFVLILATNSVRLILSSELLFARRVAVIHFFSHCYFISFLLWFSSCFAKLIKDLTRSPRLVSLFYLNRYDRETVPLFLLFIHSHFNCTLLKRSVASKSSQFCNRSFNARATIQMHSISN